MKRSKIKISGIGGIGARIVSKLAKANINEIETIAFGLTADELRDCDTIRIPLGKQARISISDTPERIRSIVEDSKKEIELHLSGSDMNFIVSTLADGVSANVVPVIVECSRKLNSVCVCVILNPFNFSVRQRHDLTMTLLKELKGLPHSLIRIDIPPNHILPMSTFLDNRDNIIADFAFEILKYMFMALRSGIVDYSQSIEFFRELGEAVVGYCEIQSQPKVKTIIEATKKSLSSISLSPKNVRKTFIMICGNLKEFTFPEMVKVTEYFERNVFDKAEKRLFGWVNDEMDSIKTILILNRYDKSEEASKDVHGKKKYTDKERMIFLPATERLKHKVRKLK